MGGSPRGFTFCFDDYASWDERSQFPGGSSKTLDSIETLAMSRESANFIDPAFLLYFQ
jgi:hypothetical protein